jgi:hypothetical protein
MGWAGWGYLNFRVKLTVCRSTGNFHKFDPVRPSPAHTAPPSPNRGPCRLGERDGSCAGAGPSYRVVQLSLSTPSLKFASKRRPRALPTCAVDLELRPASSSSSALCADLSSAPKRRPQALPPQVALEFSLEHRLRSNTGRSPELHRHGTVRVARTGWGRLLRPPV